MRFKQDDIDNMKSAASTLRLTENLSVPIERTQTWSIRGVAKRVQDLILGTAFLLVLAGPMLIIAILIRLDSRGPAVFRQVRIGRNGKPFTFYKFRTMQADNDDRAHREYVRQLIERDKPYEGESEFKIIDDPRVTRVGRILRYTSLDELMQLINVIKGEMSLVGPRPALSYEVKQYTEHEKQRLATKPGLTGLWQVSGRTKIGFKKMIELDIEYTQRRSFWLDIKIIALTIPAMIKTRGW